MLLLVVGAAVGLVASVALKFLDIWFEGRGSRARRAIAADLSLLKAAKESSVGTGVAAVELERRIELEMYAFSLAELPKAAKADMHGIAARILLGSVVTTLVVLAALIWDLLQYADSLPEPKHDRDPQIWISVALVAILFGVLTATTMGSAARSIAGSIVRRRLAVEAVLGRSGEDSEK